MDDPHERISISDAARPLFLGVDVGGTSIKLGLVDDEGRTVEWSRLPTNEERGPEDAMRRVHQRLSEVLARLALSWEDIARIGMGTPGSMDIPSGMILEPPNMPHWRYFPLRDCLAELCGRGVSFANDANAAAFGEYWIGSGRRHDSMVMFTLGTGVGGGIILDGRSLDGTHSFGSELGHLVIDQRDDARLCAWGGGRGQLEAYASAPAVVARTQERLDRGRSSRLVARLEQGETLTPLMLAEEAEAGDELALEIILETAGYLAVGIVNVVHTVDPGAVVIGGAMTFGARETEVGRRFLEETIAQFRDRAYHVVRDNTVIEFATLGSDAGYVGAAGIARSNLPR